MLHHIGSFHCPVKAGKHSHVGSSRDITSDDGRTIDPISRAVTIRELTSDEDAIGSSVLFFRFDA
jgi:hypothetical protein